MSRHTRTASEEQLRQMFDDPRFVAGYRDAEAHENLVKRLVEFRKARGLNQEDVARLMDQRIPAIVRFESSHTDPHVSTLLAYARVVGARVVIEPEEAAAEITRLRGLVKVAHHPEFRGPMLLQGRPVVRLGCGGCDLRTDIEVVDLHGSPRTDAVLDVFAAHLEALLSPSHPTDRIDR